MNSFLNKLLSKKEFAENETEIYYPDHESARKRIKDPSYQDPELCRMIAEKTKIYREKLNTIPFDVNAAHSFLLSVIQKILIEKKIDTLNIVDLGGACGAHYFEVKRLISKTCVLNWTVIETYEMVKAAKSLGLQNENLFFSSDIKKINSEPHLIHSSSTLQYIDDPHNMIKDLKNLGTEFMFFNRMMFNTGAIDLITIQQSQMADNGPGPMPLGFQNKLIQYPHTNMSYDKFTKAFLPEYRTEWIFDEPSGNIKKGNLDFIGKGMLFKKV